MFLAVHARVGMQLCSRPPLVYWVVDYTGELVNRFASGPGGKTPGKTTRGRVDFNGVAEFGECAFFMQQVHGNTHNDKFDPIFREGAFLGVEQTSHEVIFGSVGGVVMVKSADMKRQLESTIWMGAKLADIAGEVVAKVVRILPKSLRLKFRSASLTVKHDEWDPSFAADAVLNARRLKIDKEDIEENGPTRGCEKCKGVLA